MNSRILNFFNVKLDAFIVFVSVVVVIMFIALFFLLLDYLARKIMMLRLLLFMICSEEITARSVFINMMHLI